jgi:hypothetical protein
MLMRWMLILRLLMICSRSLPVALVLTLLLLLPPPNASAGDDKVEDITVPHKWFFTLYAGPHAQPDLEHVLLFDMSIEDDTYIAVAALAREFWRYEDYISFEAEGQLGKFFGKEHQGQINALVIARWLKFPWDKYVDTSFAVGEGLSYNTEVSQIEKDDDEDAGRWLNYLMFELTLGLPRYPRWNFVYRVHHRSSVRGLIGAGGSNYPTIGFKYAF